MRKLNKPLYNVRDYYITCLNGFRGEKLKHRFQSCIDTVESATSIYEEKAQEHKLFEVVVSYNDYASIAVSKTELKKLYEYQVAKKDRPGRTIYDELLLLPLNKMCPFCSVGRVRNLDHFLPKAYLPIYSVVPINLVPSCRDCNQDKNADVPTKPSEQTLHPYFDDVSEIQWLYARVAEEAIPPVIEYFTDVSAITPSELATKVVAHFYAYNLGEIFSERAAEELSNISHECSMQLLNGGANILKQHLREKKYTYEKNYKNAWQVAMYEALEQSSWFYNGGFVDGVIVENQDNVREDSICGTCKGDVTFICPDCVFKKTEECLTCRGAGILEKSSCPECKGLG